MHCRRTTSIALALPLLAGATSSQVMGLSDFTWTWVGDSTAFGTVDAALIHVQGPDYSACTQPLAYFETTAPFDGTVDAILDYTTFDICHYDWPIYLVDGVLTKIPTASGTCYLPNTVEVTFDVKAGQTFGLGVGSTDCFGGPAVGDFSQFSFSASTWSSLGGGIDPRDHAQLAPPPAAGDPGEFGSSLLAVGDVDGDGWDDVAVGDPFQAATARLTLFSGVDGQELWTATASSPVFNYPLAATGDVNNDSAPDLAVSRTPGSIVQVLDGNTGLPLWTWTGAVNGYGAALAAFGDRNNDGVLDLAVGSFSSADLPVMLLSGVDGQELGTIPLSQPGEVAGTSLAAAGDHDGDGVGDVMVTTRAPAPLVRIRSGATGAILRELLPVEPFPSVLFGRSLAALGDLDGDSVPEYAVSSPYATLELADGNPGLVTVYDGATGAALTTHAGPHPASQYGFDLDVADVDGNGVPELAVGIRAWSEPFGQTVGRADVIRPLSGVVLAHVEGVPGDAFGEQLAFTSAPSEVLLAVGAPQVNSFSGEPGRVQVFDDLSHPGGEPRITGLGSLKPDTPWALNLSSGLPGNPVTLVLGFSPLGLPAKGGQLVPSPDLLLTFPLDASGNLSLSGTWPGLVLAGPLYCQGWMLDADAPQGFSATPGLRSPLP